MSVLELEPVESIIYEPQEVIDLFREQIESGGGRVKQKDYSTEKPPLWDPKVIEVGDEKREMLCLSGYPGFGGRFGTEKLGKIFKEQNPDNFRVVEDGGGTKKLIIKYESPERNPPMGRILTFSEEQAQDIRTALMKREFDQEVQQAIEQGAEETDNDYTRLSEMGMWNPKIIKSRRSGRPMVHLNTEGYFNPKYGLKKLQNALEHADTAKDNVNKETSYISYDENGNPKKVRKLKFTPEQTSQLQNLIKEFEENN